MQTSKCYLSILQENQVDSQIPQNGVWIVQVPAMEHVAVLVLSHYAGAESRVAPKNKLKIKISFICILSYQDGVFSGHFPRHACLDQIFPPLCLGMFEQSVIPGTYIPLHIS